MTEDQLEQLCLEWFGDIGWEAAHGPDIAHDGAAPERDDYKQVLLHGDLEKAIIRLNPQLPEDAVQQAVAQVSKPQSPDLVLSNRAFHQWLLNGVPVQYKRDDEVIYDHAFLIDFERVEATASALSISSPFRAASSRGARISSALSMACRWR